jgi:hypothetical protein
MKDVLVTVLGVYVQALLVVTPIVFAIWLLAEIRHFIRAS